jgi:arsenate reductase-like glutaredoxin family protein
MSINDRVKKRPLVVGENFVLTGFKEAEWEQLKG